MSTQLSEAQLLAIAGAANFDNLYTIIFNCGLLGSYACAFAIVVHILLKKSDRSFANRILIALIGIVFILQIVSCISFIGSSLVILKYGLIVTLPGGLEAQEIAADRQPSAKVFVVTTTLFGNLDNLIADAIIAWRAWALWTENRVIQWGIIILVLANTGVNIADSVLDIKQIYSTVEMSTVTIDWVTVVLSFAVNLVATTLIGFRAWMFFKSLSLPAVSNRRKTHAEAILLLFVESGALLGVLQLADIVVQALDVNGVTLSANHQAVNMVSELSTIIACLNPLLLVVLVQTGNTYHQNTQYPGENEKEEADNQNASGNMASHIG